VKGHAALRRGLFLFAKEDSAEHGKLTSAAEAFLKSRACGTTEVVPFPIPAVAVPDGSLLCAQLADDCGNVVFLE
jgi:hypothetical protein